MKEQEARKIVNNFLGSSAAWAFVTSPFPGTTLGVVGLEATMVCQIAKVYDNNLSPAEAVSLVGNLLAGGIAVRTTLNEVLTFVPGFGYLAKAAIAGMSCYCLGEMAIEYFERKYREQYNTTRLTAFSHTIDNEISMISALPNFFDRAALR